jgi:hypothetical protein
VIAVRKRDMDANVVAGVDERAGFRLDLFVMSVVDTVRHRQGVCDKIRATELPSDDVAGVISLIAQLPAHLLRDCVPAVASPLTPKRRQLTTCGTIKTNSVPVRATSSGRLTKNI